MLLTVSMGYAKLYSGLLYSTVWREDLHVKVVWITMLALSDWNGIVSAALPGVAHAAGVSIDQCRDAIERFKAPDPDSRTKDHEGRRIEEVDGGWLILNYVKYREMRDEERRKEQVRQAVARHRERKKAGVINCQESKQCKPKKAHKDTEAEASTEAVRTTDSLADARASLSPDSSSVKASVLAPDSPLWGAQLMTEEPPADMSSDPPTPNAAWSRDACDDWQDRYGGAPPGGQIGRALKPLVEKHGWPKVRPAWRWYLASSQAEYASAARFASTFGEWSARVGAPLPL